MSIFWQGLSKATDIELLDKIMVGKNLDGATQYANINQIRNLLAAFITGNIIPQKVEAGADLGAPEQAEIYYATSGEYITPSGTITLTSSLNLLLWDKTEWSILPIDILYNRIKIVDTHDEMLATATGTVELKIFVSEASEWNDPMDFFTYYPTIGIAYMGWIFNYTE